MQADGWLAHSDPVRFRFGPFVVDEWIAVGPDGVWHEFVMGLNVAGVDVLRSNHGPVVMEVNSSPGLEGIENATGKDIAGMIIEFIEKNAKKGRTRTRGKG